MVKGSTFAAEDGEESPERWLFAAPLSTKLWLRFVKAAALEFKAAAVVVPGSIPNDGDALTGEDERLVG